MNIYDELNRRGVTRLCHFTKMKSLTHILNSPDGILSTARIKHDCLTQVDAKRADGKLDYVCCSIEYPNSWYLDSAKNRNEDAIFREWIILYIDISILKNSSVMICECNAATQNGAFIKTANEMNVTELFADKVRSFPYARKKEMLDCCPTNSQAEILIKNEIPRCYIKGIAVGDYKVAESVFAMEKTLNVDYIRIYISSDVINKKWRKMVQQGKRPIEKEYKC